MKVAEEDLNLVGAATEHKQRIREIAPARYKGKGQAGTEQESANGGGQKNT